MYKKKTENIVKEAEKVVETTPQAEPVEQKEEVKETKKGTEPKQNVSLGTNFDDYYDMTKIPQELIDAFPEMHFHLIKCDTHSINKARMKGYLICKVPESCEETHRLIKMNMYDRKIKDAYGEDVWIVGENILCYTPINRYQGRKQKLEDKRKTAQNDAALKTMSEYKEKMKDFVKDSSVSVSE